MSRGSEMVRHTRRRGVAMSMMRHRYVVGHTEKEHRSQSGTRTSDRQLRAHDHIPARLLHNGNTFTIFYTFSPATMHTR